jgi:hypothetical protein
MAPQQQRPLKSLNKGPSSKRFVFKNFAQRVEEVDVDVFRSLAPVKFQPTAGSSFFHENLVQWRVRLLVFLLCSQQDLVNVSYGSDVSSRCCVALPTFRWECFP